MTLTQQDAQELLGPHARFFVEIALEAWKSYRGYSPSQRLEHSRRSRASIVNDRMIQIADERRPAGVIPVTVSGLTLFKVGQDAVIRFKKLRPSGLASNYPTQQAIAFDNQEPVVQYQIGQQMVLPIIKEPTHINVGYVLNAFETEIRGVYATCPSKTGKLEWSLDLMSMVTKKPELMIQRQETTTATKTPPAKLPVKVRDGIVPFRKDNESKE